MNLKPISDKIVLKIKDPKEKTSGGIYLPESSQEETHIAEVIAVGEGRYSESGQLIKPSVKEGQTVVIKGKWAGENITVEGQEYKIVSDSDILAVLES